MKLSVIICAAGGSTRFGGSKNKLEVDVHGKPVLLRSVELFTGRDDVIQTLVAVNPQRFDAIKLMFGDKLGFLGATLIEGGEVERWQTVQRAMQHVDPQATHVAIHDAARPLASSQLIDRIVAAAAQFPAVVPATRVSATLKQCATEPSQVQDDGGAGDPADAILGDAGKADDAIEAYRVERTVPREALWAAQTPQVFERCMIQQAYEQLAEQPEQFARVTDDGQVIEMMNQTVHVIPGESTNIKITTPEDLLLAHALAQPGSTAGSYAMLDDPLGPKRKHPTWADMEDD